MDCTQSERRRRLRARISAKTAGHLCKAQHAWHGTGKVKVQHIKCLDHMRSRDPLQSVQHIHGMRRARPDARALLLLDVVHPAGMMQEPEHAKSMA